MTGLNDGVGRDTITRMITHPRLAGGDRREGATVIKHSHSGSTLAIKPLCRIDESRSKNWFSATICQGNAMRRD
jgi:hypothetical protein